MTVLYFGDYDADYSRTKIILKGLAKEGVNVVHVNVRKKKGLELLWALYKAHAKINEPYDALFIGVGDSRLTPILARCIARAPVIWEPLFSIYDNWVFDRKLASPYSPKALWYWLIDWIDCRVADCVVLDTKTNAEYFHTTFGIPMKKLAWIYIGADEDTFSPRAPKQKAEMFEVEFHGKYIPVQGTDVIVGAAKLLEEKGARVHFTLIGSGQEAKKTKALAEKLAVKNISFLPFLPIAEVTQYVAVADVCIGLVGDVPRVARAIPNKLYEASAMGKVSINADTPALRELFTPGENVIAIPQGSRDALAQAIEELASNPERAVMMGEKALHMYREHGTTQMVGRQTRQVIEQAIEGVLR